MMLLAALLLLGPGDLPVSLQDGASFEDESVMFRVRGGAWICDGFQFEAVRTDSVQVASKEGVLPSGGADLAIALPLDLFVLATAELSMGSHTEAAIAGLALGYRERRSPDASELLPHEASAYAGAFYGRFEVDAEGFGDFDDAVGFFGGLSASWNVTRGFLIGIQAEYRFVEFDYELDVLSGDTSAGGSGVWVGASLDFRF
jgi:hypothetical protein